MAIKRERCDIPTPADVQSRLSGMCVLTVIDMQDAYWHVRLSPESSYICTLYTPLGRERFLRMPFGISSASEVMQKRNEEAFGNIQDVHAIADDLIISVKDEAEHDAISSRVLERARQHNVKLNANKIQYKFRLPEIPSVYLRQVHRRTLRSPSTRIDYEETDRQGLTATATKDASVAAVYAERQVCTW